MSKEHKCGVYVIEQIGSDRYYIGSSKAIRNRWYQHKRELKLGSHHSRFLQNAWDKYGADAFKFWVLEECQEGELIEKEQQYLDVFKPVFNVCPTADSPSGVSKARALLRTHCPHGHEYTPENTYYGKNHPTDKRCKQCNAERIARLYAAQTPEQKAARLARNMELYWSKHKERRAKQNEYSAANREKKRLYDIAYRPIKNARRRLSAAGSI